MKRDLFIFYTEQFLTYLRDEKQVSLGTLKSYTSDILQFSHFWDSYEQIKKQQYELKKIVLQYEQWLFSQKLSSSSIARKCSCLASLNRFFIRHKREERILLQRPFVQQKTPLALQQKRINSLFDQIKNEQLPTKYPYRDRAIIELLYATGIRCSELASLLIEQVDLEAHTLFVTGSKARAVFFGDQASEKIKLYMRYERGEYALSETLFISYRNTPLTSRSIQRVCAMFTAVSPDKKKITPMLLRNSFATHLVAQGTDPLVIKELLGYTTDSSVEKYKRKK